MGLGIEFANIGLKEGEKLICDACNKMAVMDDVILQISEGAVSQVLCKECIKILFHSE